MPVARAGWLRSELRTTVEAYSFEIGATAANAGTYSVHRNRMNGLGVAGGRNDPYRNRLNARVNGVELEALRFSFAEDVQLLSVYFRAVGSNTYYVVSPADLFGELSVSERVLNNTSVDFSNEELTGREFNVAVAGVGQSLRVAGFRVAYANIPAPATLQLGLIGLVFARALRHRA